jgi:hypothetical protein
MSRENVESIRSVLPGPATDMVALFNDDSASGETDADVGTLARSGLRGSQTLSRRGAGHEAGTARPARRLACWLAPWASYRTEIEQMIDLRERVVSVICDYGRREPDAPEVALKSAVVWTVRDGRIVRAEFYAGGRDEALAAIGLAE